MTPYAAEIRRRRAQADARAIMMCRVIAVVLSLLAAAACAMFMRTGSCWWGVAGYFAGVPAGALLHLVGVRKLPL